MTSLLPTVAWSGEIRAGSLVMRCHVLHDGTRVVEADGLHAFARWAADATDAEIGAFARQYRDFVLVEDDSEH